MSRSPYESFPGASGGMRTVRKYSCKRGRMDFESDAYWVWVIREVVKPWVDKVKALPPIVAI